MRYKRILITSLICLAAVGLFAGYFYHVGKLAEGRRNQAVCGDVNIYILDSLESSAINRDDVGKMIDQSFEGVKLDDIDLCKLENSVLSHGEILTSKVYLTADGDLNVAVTQRKPVVRFENATERYYSDATGYLFPVRKPIRLPMVTGNIPLHRGSDFKGYADEEETGWITDMTSLVDDITKDKYWKEHIQQIDIDEYGDIILYLDCGPEKIIFGNREDCGGKMRKLKAYYETIAPKHAPKVYSSVNLKYKNQIICK